MKYNPPSDYLIKHLEHIWPLKVSGSVLDLACGTGSNGLYLAEKGARVHFWDQNSEKLAQIKRIARLKGFDTSFKKIDLETGQGSVLPEEYFSLIMVFRYLHRPLMPEIKNAVLPGGTIIYETFTIRQAQLGKPSNPDFLLNDGELKEWFSDWAILDHYEAELLDPIRYMAGIIARKSSPGI
ncbi:methyltransferase domain-containing protein [Desulfonatronovibrio magnus]|uniref:methyltransferase domain-containing protein n=1 Tax=Desulfonatronovibrio magnus TaxID=698827 RepID=UPI0005EB8123|nr:methyltransferase domain-containing protein [Desulfonatronovibrio magnus]